MLTHYAQVEQSSDLQALCLTSKEWNYIATESLYKAIIIDINIHNSQLGAFDACLHLGASRSLRYTRSLSLYDFPRKNDLAEKKEKPNIREYIELLERPQAILRILQLVPENNLHTFR
jgi:hypothetical protein